MFMGLNVKHTNLIIQSFLAIEIIKKFGWGGRTNMTFIMSRDTMNGGH